MGIIDRLFIKILKGTSDSDIPFNGLGRLLEKVGFEQRLSGDHIIFSREGLEEIIVLQPRGSKAKPYQVKLVREILLRHKISLESNDE